MLRGFSQAFHVLSVLEHSSCRAMSWELLAYAIKLAVRRGVV